MRQKYILILLLVGILFSQCVDDQSKNPIPGGYVGTTVIDLSDLENVHLKTRGNSRVLLNQGGYGGLVIYYSTNGTYFAFDAACPHEASRDVHVFTNPKFKYTDIDETYADGDEPNATCPECGSTYDLIFETGGVTSGKSVHPLRAYKTARNGDYLRIYSED